MTHSIHNEHLEISVDEKGAELSRIRSTVTGTDYLWDADAEVWASHAPVLFPVIGAIKNGHARYKGDEYAVPRHGFVRNNTKVRLTAQSETSLTFALRYDDETLAIYPFQFLFDITYRLDGNKIFIDHRIRNEGDGEMLFSVGGHPAFKCPVHKGENYEDYYLEFEAVENDVTWLLNKEGLVENQTRPVLENTNILPLHHHLFDHDALIFKHLISRKVSLRSTKSAQVITVNFDDFKYLGIWAKPNGDFVCIEPWLGIADNAESDQNFETKEGIIKLSANGTFNASFSIEIHE